MITKQFKGRQYSADTVESFEIIKDNFSRKVSGNGLESLLKMHKYDTPSH